MKNFDGMEWLNYRIRIETPKDFFKDYNDTKGQIAIRQKINQSKLLSSIAEANINKNKKNEDIGNNISSNNSRLMMTGLPNNINEKEVRKIVESYGQIKFFRLISKKNNEEINNTLCFFEYELQQNAYKALKGLNNINCAGNSQQISPKRKSNYDISKSSCNLMHKT